MPGVARARGGSRHRERATRRGPAKNTRTWKRREARGAPGTARRADLLVRRMRELARRPTKSKTSKHVWVRLLGPGPLAKFPFSPQQGKISARLSALWLDTTR